MRLLALTGVLAVALWLAGSLVVNVLTDLPGSTASPEERLAYVRDDPHRIFLGGFAFQLGSVAFVFFLGSLRTRLVEADRRDGTLPAVAFGAGIGTAVLSMGILAGFMVAALQRESLPPATADMLSRLGDPAFDAAKLFAIPLVVACALVALRTAVFPRAHAWAGVGLAVWLALPLWGWAGFLYGFPAWVLATSVLLARQWSPAERREKSAEAPTSDARPEVSPPDAPAFPLGQG